MVLHLEAPAPEVAGSILSLEDITSEKRILKEGVSVYIPLNDNDDQQNE
jgi:hypothetical protein